MVFKEIKMLPPFYRYFIGDFRGYIFFFVETYPRGEWFGNMSRNKFQLGFVIKSFWYLTHNCPRPLRVVLWTNNILWRQTNYQWKMRLDEISPSKRQHSKLEKWLDFWSSHQCMDIQCFKIHRWRTKLQPMFPFPCRKNSINLWPNLCIF